MPITMQQYLENPMGKGSSVIPNRFYIIKDLEVRYEKLVKKKDFEPDVYFIKDSFFFHFSIPSETERNNSYDVVLEFDPTETILGKNFIREYNMKVFSNCPSFTYTYAYVFNDNDLMIKFLRKKYDKITLTDQPSTRNPGQIISFEKSTYFACLYLKQHSNLLNRAYLKTVALKTNGILLASKIRPTNLIEKEIEKENNRLKADKEEKKENLRKAVQKNSKRDTIKAINAVNEKNHKITPKKKITGKRAKKKIH